MVLVSPEHESQLIDLPQLTPTANDVRREWHGLQICPPLHWNSNPVGHANADNWTQTLGADGPALRYRLAQKRSVEPLELRFNTHTVDSFKGLAVIILTPTGIEARLFPQVAADTPDTHGQIGVEFDLGTSRDIEVTLLDLYPYDMNNPRDFLVHVRKLKGLIKPAAAERQALIDSLELLTPSEAEEMRKILGL
ncbi:hypothetical protein HY612_04235 [Candidatus Roizmanbacteria bacterium]|nr:hypothetical protein [Candidatus Roizmanbacteria bacterium]